MFFSKTHDILEFLNFLYSPQITQYNFLVVLVIEKISGFFYKSCKFAQSNKLLPFNIKAINQIQNYPYIIKLYACIL